MKFSIITVSWNAEKTIGETLRSVMQQDCDDFEIVVVDGKSTDRTLEIVEECVEKYNFPKSRILIHSEKDRGIYDAMNKGVKFANGDYVLFMNCGDAFHDEKALSNFAKAIEKGEDADVYYGNTIRHCPEGTGLYSEGEGSTVCSVMPFCHQSAITKRSVMLEHPFNLDYKICADFELFYWLRQHNYKFKHEDFVVADYDNTFGMSANSSVKLLLEKHRILGIDKQKDYSWKKYVIIGKLKLKLFIMSLMPKRVLYPMQRRQKQYISYF